ncbi:MAG: hypothetical protein WAS27_01620 [Candidatus Saccharimonadales bacterium]
MDGGPFRGSTRPAARSTVARSDVDDRPSSVSKPTPEDAGQTIGRTVPHYESKESPVVKRVLIALLATLIIIVTIVAGWFIWSQVRGSGPTAIDTDKYQAVLLTNGESYFGKLTPLNNDFMRLTDVYYLKPQSEDKTTDDNSQQKTTADSSFQLIKFGGEVQGPEDEIIVAVKQIIYYENLSPDGKASQAIKQHKAAN